MRCLISLMLCAWYLKSLVLKLKANWPAWYSSPSITDGTYSQKNNKHRTTHAAVKFSPNYHNFVLTRPVWILEYQKTFPFFHANISARCHEPNHYRRLLVSKFLLNRWRNGWSKWILPLLRPPKIMGYYEKNPFKNRRQVCSIALFLISKYMFATPFFSNIFIIYLSLAIITAANRCWIPLDPKRYLRILCPLW